MITPIEADQLASESRKIADRSAEVETLIDEAIAAAARSGEIGTVEARIPYDLQPSIQIALNRYRGVGWTASIASSGSGFWTVVLTIVRRKA